MLTLESTNDALEALYATYKQHSESLFESVKSLGEPISLKSDTDLLALSESHSGGVVIFITEGYFRLIVDNKVVRLYSDSDFVGAYSNVTDVQLTSEFASDVMLFNWAELFRHFMAYPQLAQQWCRLMDIENNLNLGLCAQLVDERIQPSLELRQFKAGETIIEEGAEALEIYEMISGLATVSVAGQNVGEINAGEIFGEMSFLVECPRTATVIADSACCVRVVKKTDFFALIEVDRHLSAAIAKTMAKRVIELNRRLSGGA